MPHPWNRFRTTSRCVSPSVPFYNVPIHRCILRTCISTRKGSKAKAL